VVAHLDADTLPTRDWLVEIAAPFADPAVIQVAGRMVGYRPSTPAERYYARNFLDRGQANANERKFPFAASGNMAVRRNALLDVGGWDEEFRVSQDVDLSCRLLRRFRAPIRYQAGALALVRTSRTVAELKGRAFKYGQGRAKLWLRYPDLATWTPRYAARVTRRLTATAVTPHLLSIARRAGRATADELEEAICNRAWNWSLWHGFASMMRHREWRRLGPG
jgi:cellulose synthase/poly-beta-1,6-N-acetylglucosamine synthase-like glycosyltransferase